MPRITFASNIRGIVTAIESAQGNIKEAKIDGLGMIAKEAFCQVGSKYIVKGNWSTPSKSGNSLKYTTPPGANINVRRTVAFNPKTKFRKVKEIAMFVKGKFVSRSGTYERLITELANKVYREGSTTVNGVRIELNENYLRVYADDKSEFFKLETMKRKSGGRIGPVQKTFRSAVNLWKKVRIRMGRG